MSDAAKQVAITPKTQIEDVGSRTLARVAPVIFLLLWSSGFAVAKVGLQHAQPLTFLTLRYALIVLLVLPAFLILRPPVPSRPATWGHIAVVGFLIQTVYFGLAYTALGLGVSAGAAALITSTQPIVVALAAPWLAAERVGARRWTGLLLGAAGAMAVIAATTSIDGRLSGGIALCLLSMLGMAAATLYQKRYATDVHPITVNLVHYVIGLVTLGPLAATFEGLRVDWGVPLISSLAWIAIANSVVAISLLLFMIRRSAAARVSSLFFLVPPMAAVFGWFLVGETLSPLACAGMLLAAAGVWLASRSG